MAAAAALAVAVPASATEPGAGSAYGADAHVSLLPNVLGPSGITVATGQLAASNTAGPTTASAVDATLQGLVSAKAITSSATHDATDGTVTATAELVTVALPVLAAVAGLSPTASVISSQCHATADGITGSSDLADLNLGRIGSVSAATPNLTVGIPGILQIVANEQIHHADGSFTVNALDIRLLGTGLASAVGSGQIVLASSTCGAATTVTSTPVPTTPTPTTATPTTAEVRVVPAGAPQTGDGSLATMIVH